MRGLISSQLRPEHPDFLDLPWIHPLEAWEGVCPRLERMPAGESRHPVVFVGYDDRVYAVKSMPVGIAEREYRVLREMEEIGLPSVVPVGHLICDTGQGRHSVLLTRYLDYSLPYHSLFLKSRLRRYRDHLLDAMAGLLVQLHLAGVYWGDCSLFNTLFRRDAGTLQAYLVDAETSEIHPALSDGMRAHDLDLMEENVAGALCDLAAMGALDEGFSALDLAADVRRRYEGLWHEISRADELTPRERWRIEERVRALNALGFTVGEIELQAKDGGERLKLTVSVTDRSFNRRMLHSLTGLEVQEHQARQLVNEIQQVRAWLSRERNRSVSLSAAGFHWLEELYQPVVDRLVQVAGDDEEPAELYCQVLEHKWYMSESAQRDVGLQAAVDDFLVHLEVAPANDDREVSSSF